MKIDEKNDARSVDARKFEIRLSFPLKSQFLQILFFLITCLKG